MLRFEDPWLFLALLIIPPIVYVYIKRLRGGRVKFSRVDTLKKLRQSGSVKFRHVLIVFRCLGILLLTLAVARPQSGKVTTEILTEGVDIILTLDTSGSMEALDFELEGKRVNRLEVVKKVVTEFIKGRENDRIGMVVFAREAFTQCPLTLDHGVLMSFLERVEIGIAGDGTAIGSALGVSVNRLKDSKSKSRVIILLTDGRNNYGRLTPEEAAKIAKTFDIKVYTIGAGTKGEVPFLVNTLFGKKYVYQRLDLDEGTLNNIAATTGGRFYLATDTKALEAVYKEIDELEKTEVKVKEYKEYRELFSWFILSGLVLILAEIGLGNTRFRKIP